VDGPRELPAASGGTCSLRFKANAKTFPDLADHVINGEPIFPAAAYMDLVRFVIYCFLRDLVWLGRYYKVAPKSYGMLISRLSCPSLPRRLEKHESNMKEASGL
jgi:hypothetical protein